MKIPRLFLFTALLQGGAFWWLSYSLDTGLWPNNPLIRTSALFLAIYTPLVIYWTRAINQLPKNNRRLIILFYAVAYTALGAYIGWASGGFTHVSLKTHYFTFVASTLLCFVSIHLLLSFDRAERRWNYDQFFYYCWRNGILIVTALLITAVCWIVFWAGAELMAIINVQWFRNLIQKPAFIYPVTSLVAAAAFSFGLSRPAITELSQRFAFTLASWLLILLLFFGVIWVGALPFTTGLSILFETRSTTLITFFFAVIAIKFYNCIYQDGHTSNLKWPYAPWLTRAIQIAWLSLLPIVAIGCWAIWLRVEQYGWTPARFWAALLALLLVIYIVGYVLSWLSQVSGIITVAHTNIAGALILCVGLIAFLTPVADVNRLSVISQMNKIKTGNITPDWTFLRDKSTRFGREQLEKMATGSDVQTASRWSKPAKDALAFNNLNASLYPSLTIQDLINRFNVYPTGQTLPAGFVGYIRSPIVDARVKNCILTKQKCNLWIGDLKGDGQAEIVFFDQTSVGNNRGVLFSMINNQWRMIGYVAGKNNLAVTADQLEQAQTTPSEWRELIIAGVHYRVLLTP